MRNSTVPGVLIADGGQTPLEGLGDVLANPGRDLKRGRLFNQLLVAALDGALTLAQGDHVAVLVGQDLELDVPGTLDEFLHVQVAVAEGVRRLGLRRLIELGQLLLGANDAHAASATARRGFEDDRKANRPGPCQGLFLILQHAFGTRQDGDFRLLHRLASFILLAHQPHGFGSGPDELDVRSAANLGEVRVLTQQAVAGMNGIDIGDLRGRDDGRDIQIALRRSRRPDADRLVGKTDVERVAVRLAVDGNRADPEFFAGADDAKRDFAAVGDEQFSKHRFQSGPEHRTVAVTFRRGRI